MARKDRFQINAAGAAVHQSIDAAPSPHTTGFIINFNTVAFGPVPVDPC